MYCKDDLLSTWLTDIKTRGACLDGTSWVESILNDNPNCTMEQMLLAFLEEGTGDQAWSVWALTNYYSEFDERIRELLIKKISDSMTAFSLYLELEELTDADDILLESIFKGKLPAAEKELEEKIINRKKV